jgi:tetratricopeptide (TPR) repeat protein
MKQIESTMSRDARPYYQAANYYYENGKDLKLALEWINKAVEMSPKAYWIALLKAKIQKDLKDYNGALATSQLSYNLAKEQGNDTYMKNNERLMAEIKAMPDYKPEPKGKRK